MELTGRQTSAFILIWLLQAYGSLAVAQRSEPDLADDDATPARASEPEASKDPSSVIIRAKPWLFNSDTRYAHSLPEVDGATITVTKKTSVVKLGEQPTMIDNNQRELFDRLPGIVLAEQQNPTQLNLSYRGLGNPQESEYVLLMQDGVPLELDWIGYPTIYYLPAPQTLGAVQMIRAGSGLLYGPEPQPVINFISRAPEPGRAAAGTSEQVGGANALFSSFNAVSGTAGRWDYLADYSRRQSDGQRANGDYALNAGDLHIGYRPDDRQTLSVAVHAYSLDSGLAGLMSAAQFQADRNQTTTPDDRLWTDRYTAVLAYENKLTEHDLYIQKLWTGYQDLVTRSDKYTPGTALGTGATLSAQRFHYTGLDGRLLHRWGAGNALTVGYTAYWSRSPYNQFVTQNPLVSRDDESGRPFYVAERQTRYAALFAENAFRFKRFHLVTSARFDHEELKSRERLAPHPLLVNATYRKSIPLFGLGIGNDFGRGNESYLNISQGFRPLRYLDVASPFSNFSATNNPDPTRYLTYEAGVHGWPSAGLYYDASLFQVNVRDRIESRQLTQTQTVDVNTGNTRSRGAELEGSYDLLRIWPQSTPGRHVTVFANASFLDARFTGSRIPGQEGKTPAYAPDYVVKAGLTVRQDRHYKISLIAASVASQYFQDSNLAVGSTPARIPAYTVFDLSGDYVIAGHLRLLGGIANLADRHYYSRVFLFGGQLEPARDRTFHAGVAYDF
ncbi:MAG: TonB-dependent receptor family protein [Steroidobacteraceae bacterium]